MIPDTMDRFGERAEILKRLFEYTKRHLWAIFVVNLYAEPGLRDCPSLTSHIVSWDTFYYHKWTEAKTKLVQTPWAKDRPQSWLTDEVIWREVSKEITRTELDEWLHILQDRVDVIAYELPEQDFAAIVEQLVRPVIEDFFFYGETVCVLNGKVVFTSARQIAEELFGKALSEWGAPAYYFMRELVEYVEPVRVSEVTAWFSGQGLYLPLKLAKDLTGLGLLEDVHYRSQHFGYRFRYGLAPIVRSLLDSTTPPPLPYAGTRPTKRMDGSTSLPNRARHSSTSTALKQIATRLGLQGTLEFSFDDFRLDAVWKDGTSVTHAFEVQHKGSLEHALTNLLAAVQHFGSIPMLVVSDPLDRRRALRLVNKQGAPFAALQKKLVILDMSHVFTLSRWLKVRDEDVKETLKLLRVKAAPPVAS